MADDTETDSDIDDTDAQNLLADAVDTEPDTGTDSSDQQGELDRLRKDVTKWKSLARKHEGTARQRSEAASKAQSLEEQVSDLRKQMAERDVAQVERAGRLAMAQVRTHLASAGIKPDDVAAILDGYDPTVLLADGEPDDDAITKLATSLTKVAGRVQPDHDQGRKGGNTPPNMNDLIRRAAGIRIN